MSDTSLSVLVVDDERPPLEDLARILTEDPRVGQVETVLGSREALARAASADYDAIFVDVRMPGLDGIELARVVNRMRKPPALVFVTAFDDTAVTAFELRAIDYLLKPVTPARVSEAVQRIASRSSSAGASESVVASAAPMPADARILAVENMVGGGTRLIPISSVLYMEARGDYIRVIADGGRYAMRGYLAKIEQQFGSQGFVRVHRRYVVNLHRASEMRALRNGTGELSFDNDIRVPIARRQLPGLRRYLQR